MTTSGEVGAPPPAVPDRRPHPGPRSRPGAQTGPEARERGAGTVLVVGLMLVGLVLATGTATLGQAVVSRHRAVAAADLAALAAADVLVGRTRGDACVAAGRTAAAGGATVTGCEPVGQEVVVRVVVPVDGLLAALGPASAAAHAGPARSP